VREHLKNRNNVYLLLCSAVYTFSINNTFDKPVFISSIIITEIVPNFFINLSCDTERTWKQSADDALTSPFFELGSIFTIHGAISYLPFQIRNRNNDL